MIIYNDDTSSLRYSYTQPPHTEEDIRLPIERLKAGNVGALCWLLGHTIAHSWPSQAWDNYYERLAKGCAILAFDDEIGFAPDEGQVSSYQALPPGEDPRNVMLGFHRRGVDYLPLFIRETRRAGMRFYGSFRMNDCHLKSDPDGILSSSFWRNNQELRLWGVKAGRTYYNAALDYSYPEVRSHHLRGIVECLEWYDMDGLELDFCRNPYLFQPAEGWEKRDILTGFIREVRAALKAAEERWGHKLDLLVRVPFSDQLRQEAGMDVAAWICEGLVDILVMSSLLNDYRQKIEPWQSLCTAHGVDFYPSVEQGPVNAAPAHNHITIETVDEIVQRQRGAAINFLAQGAKGVYLFNHACLLYQVRRQPEEANALVSMLSELDDSDAMAKKPAQFVFWDQLPLELESMRPPEFYQTIGFIVNASMQKRETPEVTISFHQHCIPNPHGETGNPLPSVLPKGWITYLLNGEEVPQEWIESTLVSAGKIASGFTLQEHEKITLRTPPALLREGQNTLAFHIRKFPEPDDPYVSIYELVVAI